jgi:hypothetical protein
MKIMKRQSKKDDRADGESGNNVAEDHTKILQRKQEAYLKMRAEFFAGDQTESLADEEEDVQSSQPAVESNEENRAIPDVELYTRRHTNPSQRVAYEEYPSAGMYYPDGAIPPEAMMYSPPMVYVPVPVCISFNRFVTDHSN